MKTVRNSLFFSLLLLSMVLVTLAGFVAERDASRAVAAQSNPLALDEAAPDLAVIAEGPIVTLGWTEILGAKGYRLLFSFYYGDTVDELYEIDMGYATELTLNFDSEAILDTFDNLGSFAILEEGLAFYVRVEAYDHEGSSRQSNVEHVLVGANAYRFQGEDTVGGGEQPSSITARVACIFPVEPCRSCVDILGGTQIFVPVGDTNPFTASGSTGGFTCISRDPAIVNSGFASPDQGLGWITGVSEGSTVIDIWNSAGCWTPMSVRVVPAGGYYIYLSNLSPAPYPDSYLMAGAQVAISSVFTFPPIDGYIAYYGYYGSWGSAAASNSPASAQAVFGDTLRLESGTRSAGWSYQMDVVPIPYGYDYLIIWAELRASDNITILAQSCQTGWLIFQ